MILESMVNYVSWDCFECIDTWSSITWSVGELQWSPTSGMWIMLSFFI